MAKLIGEWTINWGGFANRGWPASLEGLVMSHAPDILGGGTVDDFSATVDESRQPCDPYLRILPFGPHSTAVNDVVQNGDILSFVQPSLQGQDAINMLQQRGWHAEICYKSEGGIAYQRAPWHNGQRDEPCNVGQPDWMIHVFRPILPGLDPAQEEALKRQVFLWKEIFSMHHFPEDGDQYTSSHKYLDPADFGSVPEIENLARKLVSRPSLIYS